MIANLLLAITGATITVVGLICVTVLLLNGHKVPPEMWGFMGSSAGTAAIGGAIAQGASVATHQTPNIDRLYRQRTK